MPVMISNFRILRIASLSSGVAVFCTILSSRTDRIVICLRMNAIAPLILSAISGLR